MVKCFAPHGHIRTVCLTRDPTWLVTRVRSWIWKQSWFQNSAAEARVNIQVQAQQKSIVCVQCVYAYIHVHVLHIITCSTLTFCSQPKSTHTKRVRLDYCRQNFKLMGLVLPASMLNLSMWLCFPHLDKLNLWTYFWSRQQLKFRRTEAKHLFQNSTCVKSFVKDHSASETTWNPVIPKKTSQGIIESNCLARWPSPGRAGQFWNRWFWHWLRMASSPCFLDSGSASQPGETHTFLWSSTHARCSQFTASTRFMLRLSDA